MKWPNIQWINLLKPAPYIDPILDSKKVDAQYHYWRIRICLSLFFGYAVYYVTRKNFAVVMPLIGSDLAFDKGQLGLILSFFSISYGVNKFIAGIISDRSNPRYLMAFGLIATGVMNILFGMASSFWVLAFFWVINGFFQACGWPACCKSLTYWFTQSNRGFWYGVCSTSHNIGSAFIALFAPFVALQYGWRFAMYIPAFISIAMGLFLIYCLRDVPQTLGLPPVDDYVKNNPNLKTTLSEKSHSFLTIKETLFKQVLNNKYVWIFSLSYFFIYIVRTAVNDWSAFYLIEVKHFPDILTAGQGVFWFEVGGLAGMLVTGWGSDYFFRGNRVPVMVLSALGLMLSVGALWYSTSGSMAIDLFWLACIGFFVFGPQMIIGLAAAEFVDKRAAAASNGFAGFLGYIGAAVAGFPIGKVIDIWQWDGYYICMLISSFIIFIMLLPLWSFSSAAVAARSSEKIEQKIEEKVSEKILAT